MKKLEKHTIIKYSFAVMLIVAGILLNYFGYNDDFMGFPSVGSWIIYVGFIMVAIVTLQKFNKKKRIVDERMHFIGNKAARITFTALIFFAFIIMIIDGIKEITFAYSYFMSYLICGVLLVYFISYKILSKYY